MFYIASPPIIFVHIPKTGGISLHHSLIYNKAPIESCKYEGMGVRLHLTSEKVAQRIGEENYKKCETFSLVRNPFARMVSLFFYEHRGWKRIHKLDHQAVVDRFVGWAYKGHDKEWHQPQITWVSKIDKTYKLENDLPELHAWIEDKIKMKIDWTVENTTNHLHYREYYTPELRAFYEKEFKEDFDHFGYSW